MKKTLILISLFFLSSCMKLDSEIVLDANGVATSKATIDMSKFMSMMSAFGSGSEADGVNKNLCLDESFSGGLYESLSEEKYPLTNVSCTSIGDYQAMIVGTQNYSKKKGVLLLSGVTIVDMLALGDEDRLPRTGSNDDFAPMDAENLGFSIRQSYTLPGKIAFREGGSLSGANTVVLNLLDPKVTKKQSLIVIATADGKKLTPREINAYKLKLRKHNKSIR